MSNADTSNAVKNNKTKLTKVNLTEFKLDKEMKTFISAKILSYWSFYWATRLCDLKVCYKT